MKRGVFFIWVRQEDSIHEFIWLEMYIYAKCEKLGKDGFGSKKLRILRGQKQKQKIAARLITKEIRSLKVI